MAHTPGEWELQLDGIDYRVVSQSQYTPIVVATVHATDENDDIGSREGNANVIAAAPDLLAALHGMVELVRTYRGNWTESPPVNIAIAAIAKAKGGAQ